jgi:hypothetical protein
VVKALLRFVPTEATAEAMATPIKEAIKAYSITVTPCSSLQRQRNMANIGYPPQTELAQFLFDDWIDFNKIDA